MNAVYNNMQFINSLLPNILLDSVVLLDSSVSYNISPADILSKMNAVETNIQAIHTQLKRMNGWTENYYSEFVWQKNTTNKKKEVDRWIDWLNDVFFMLKDTIVLQVLLTDENNEVITDQSGEEIYTLERIFNNGNI